MLHSMNYAREFYAIDLQTHTVNICKIYNYQCTYTNSNYYLVKFTGWNNK